MPLSRSFDGDCGRGPRQSKSASCKKGSSSANHPHPIIRAFIWGIKERFQIADVLVDSRQYHALLVCVARPLRVCLVTRRETKTIRSHEPGPLHTHIIIHHLSSCKRASSIGHHTQTVRCSTHFGCTLAFFGVGSAKDSFVEIGIYIEPRLWAACVILVTRRNEGQWAYVQDTACPPKLRCSVPDRLIEACPC
jgi:hypothetical protein